MRILQIVHDFLPRHVAGVEVYTDLLSRQLARDHEVAVLYSEVVQDVPDFTLRRGVHGGLRTYEIVNNHRYRRFEETWWNAQIDRCVGRVLDEFRPDVVHIQHLLNLSLGVVREIDRRGIPMLMTLHDHWLECANGGQRFHPELGRCDILDARRCGSCTAHLHGVGLGARGALVRFRTARAQEGREVSLVDLRPDAVESPEASFVYRDRYELHGVLRPTWVAHPPSRLAFGLECGPGARLTVACGLHPSTFGRPGPGVIFRIRVNGELRAERFLDPKRRIEDRDPVILAVDLKVGVSHLELETSVASEAPAEHCTAGWIDPRVDAAVPDRVLGEGLAMRVAHRVGRRAFQFSARRQARRIESRWAAVRRLAERVDLFLAPSAYLAEQFCAFGLPEDKVRISDYGFDTTAFERRTDLPAKLRSFAFLGSLVPHKGVHILLDAFEALPSDARLEIFGSPDYRPAYAAHLRSRARHPGIRFRGGVPPAQVPSVLHSIDALVVPSIWRENSPLTIHEAFLAGVPVVASRLGGSEGLLRRGGGLLYAADDSKELEAALRRLYEEPGLGRELAGSAPKVKTLEEDAGELVARYREILSSRRGHRGIA